MAEVLEPLERLTDMFRRLDGVGKKSAARYAFCVLNFTDEEAAEFARAILAAKTEIRKCAVCQNITTDEICPICQSESRDHKTICVVEDPRALLAIEKTRQYGGVYHVLHGTISTMRGVTPDRLTIKELLARLGDPEHRRRPRIRGRSHPAPRDGRKIRPRVRRERHACGCCPKTVRTAVFFLPPFCAGSTAGCRIAAFLAYASLAKSPVSCYPIGRNRKRRISDGTQTAFRQKSRDRAAPDRAVAGGACGEARRDGAGGLKMGVRLRDPGRGTASRALPPLRHDGQRAARGHRSHCGHEHRRRAGSRGTGALPGRRGSIRSFRSGGGSRCAAG